MTYVRLKSLRTRFLALLALGGLLVASAGLWITYTTTVGHFEAQLVERGKLLADSLNHSAMVADTPMQVQHIVDELSLSPHIQSIVVATGQPPEIMASSNRAWNSTRLDQLPDRHLGEHLLQAIARGDFGHHFDNDGAALILTAPLEPQLTNHQGHDTFMMPSGASPEHGTAHGHGVTHMDGPSQGIEPSTTSNPLPYRGAIMLFLDNKGASTAVSQILWLLCIALLAAVLITMSIAYVLVDRQILARLNAIRRAMTRQDASAGAARVPVVANDEISDLGRAFNNMVDRIDAETRRREDLVKELKDSEERFRSVVNNSPTKIHIKNVEGRYVLVNSEAEKLFGVTQEEAKGKTSHEIFPGRQADDFRLHDQAVLETGQTLEQEEQWHLDDGVHTYLTVKFPIRDSDDKIVAIGAIGTDITERKRAEEALRESRDQIHLIADNLPVLISYYDNEYRIHFGNKTLEEWYARPVKEILGRTIEECIGPEGFGRMSARLEAAYSGTPQHYEHTTTYPDGFSRTVDALYVPHIDEAGTVQGCFALVQDISERKAVEEAMLAVMKEAEIANQTKTEFLANMSHELRTPLNAIIGFSEIIKDETLGPVGSTKYREYADDINESGQHLLALINNILDLSKIESGTDELHEENIEIPEIANAIMRLVVGLDQNGNVELELDVSDDIPLLYADERKVKQILLNLISNAIKFTPDSGKVTLKIWSRDENGYVFQVTDTGIGIAFEEIPKALAPFQQIDSGLSRKHDGTGLGLPLTRALVEMHGGYLDLQSEVGVGTTVTVCFPAERISHLPRDTKAASAAAKKAG